MRSVVSPKQFHKPTSTLLASSRAFPMGIFHVGFSRTEPSARASPVCSPCAGPAQPLASKCFRTWRAFLPPRLPLVPPPRLQLPGHFCPAPALLPVSDLALEQARVPGPAALPSAALPALFCCFFFFFFFSFVPPPVDAFGEVQPGSRKVLVLNCVSVTTPKPGISFTPRCVPAGILVS